VVVVVPVLVVPLPVLPVPVLVVPLPVLPVPVLAVPLDPPVAALSGFGGLAAELAPFVNVAGDAVAWRQTVTPTETGRAPLSMNVTFAGNAPGSVAWRVRTVSHFVPLASGWFTQPSRYGVHSGSSGATLVIVTVAEPVFSAVKRVCALIAPDVLRVSSASCSGLN
jgi:hypothetical protein